jgi:hypothetical protein
MREQLTPSSWAWSARTAGPSPPGAAPCPRSGPGRRGRAWPDPTAGSRPGHLRTDSSALPVPSAHHRDRTGDLRLFRAALDLPSSVGMAGEAPDPRDVGARFSWCRAGNYPRDVRRSRLESVGGHQGVAVVAAELHLARCNRVTPRRPARLPPALYSCHFRCGVLKWCRVHAHLSGGGRSRGDRVRTCNLRFWRTVRFQLCHAPVRLCSEGREAASPWFGRRLPRRAVSSGA